MTLLQSHWEALMDKSMDYIPYVTYVPVSLTSYKCEYCGLRQSNYERCYGCGAGRTK